MAEHPEGQSVALVHLSGDREGSYEVVGEDADGTLHLRRETPAAASLRGMGLVAASLEEGEAEHGPMLPPDDEL